MRQLTKLLRVVQRAELVEQYSRLTVQTIPAGAKLIPLDEFLSVALGQKPAEQVSEFDKKADEFLEAQALKRLEERRKQHGK